MELQLALLADNAHADASGKLYILGEFRYIQTEKVPAFHGQMSLVLRIVAPVVEVPENRARLRLQFVDADGHPWLPQNPPEIEIQFNPIGPAERGVTNAQAIIGMGNFPLLKFGDCVIHVWVNDKRIGETKFHILKAEPSGAQSAK